MHLSFLQLLVVILGSIVLGALLGYGLMCLLIMFGTRRW